MLSPISSVRFRVSAVVAALLTSLLAGCYAPMRSPGISAKTLPDSFRTPFRTVGMPRNYAELASPQPAVYRLGPGDKLDATIPGLLGDTRDGLRPVRVEVMENGAIQLPLVGPVHVGGLGLADAQQVVNEAYADGYLEDRRVTLHLFEKGTVSVVVLGAVNKPGTYLLPRYENDVARALASAEGLSDVAGDLVEVHRNPATCGAFPQQPAPEPAPLSPTPLSPDALWPPAPAQPIQQTAAYAPEPVEAPLAPQRMPPAAYRAPGHAQPPRPYVNVPRTNNPYATGRYGTPSPVTAQTTGGPFPAQPVPAEFAGHLAMPPEVPYHAEQYGSPEPYGPAEQFGSPVPTSSVAMPYAHPGPHPAGVPLDQVYPPSAAAGLHDHGQRDIVRIPLRGPHVQSVPPGECVLSAGDVVFVPERTQQVFYVVGPLSRDNRTGFTIGDDEREIGSGFLLPPDREIDVVTAVAMAGYIDPIESPTTVTLHRAQPGQTPLLVKVDLIEARTDARENLLVAPGDIIYLNPDPPWYFRRVFDQVIPTGLGIALGRAVSD